MAATRKQKNALRNVSRLRKKLRNMPKDVTRGVQKTIADEAEIVHFEMLKALSGFVGSSELAETIEFKISRDKLSAQIGPGARTKRAQARAWYAKFVEFGAYDYAGRSFVFEPFKRRYSKIKRNIDRSVDIALKRFTIR